MLLQHHGTPPHTIERKREICEKYGFVIKVASVSVLGAFVEWQLDTTKGICCGQKGKPDILPVLMIRVVLTC